MSGKKAADFLTGSDRSCCMGVNKWAEAVGLTVEEISAFRYLTKKEMSTEICIHSLSKLFGVKLFYNSYEAMAEEDLWDKDAENLLKEKSMHYEFGSISIMKEKTGYSVNYSLRECEEELLELMEIPAGNKKREADLPEILPVYAFSAVVQGKYEYLQAKGESRRKELRKLEFKNF